MNKDTTTSEGSDLLDFYKQGYLDGRKFTDEKLTLGDIAKDCRLAFEKIFSDKGMPEIEEEVTVEIIDRAAKP